MRPLEQIQAINEQLNGPGVWDGTAPKPASEHVALQADASSPAIKKLNEQASDAIAEYTKKNNLLSDFMLKGF